MHGARAGERARAGRAAGALAAAAAALALCVWARPCEGARSREPPTVTLPKQGTLMGREVAALRNQKVVLYLQIPYVAAPARFAPPNATQLPRWEGVRNASEWPPACMQNKLTLSKTHGLFANSDVFAALKFQEDCLFLNVFVPDGNPPNEGWPVMVWIHPGKFITGAISLWDGTYLAAKQKVIVVTVAYRLNVFGFSSKIGKTFSHSNNGMLDQVAALHWISDSIVHFKGSPKDICLFGYGAGAVSVGLHMLSPLSKNKFHRAIAMSGNALVPGSIQSDRNLKKNMEYLAGLYLCEKKADNMKIIECLTHINNESMQKGDWQDILDWGPGIEDITVNMEDTPFLTDDPKSLLMNGPMNKVDFMTGFTHMEDALEADIGPDIEKGLTQSTFETHLMGFINADLLLSADFSNESCPTDEELLKAALSFYYSPQPISDETMLLDKLMSVPTERKYGSTAYLQAMHVSESGAKTYMYRFDYKLKTKIPNDIEMPSWATVPHLFDLPFLWGMPYMNSWPSVVWNNADRKHADTVMTLWTNFAKFSNPSQSGTTVKWDMFNKTNPSFMLIDKVLNMSDPMSTNIDYKAFAFWNDYYPLLRERATACCNVTAHGVSLHSQPVTMVVWALLFGTPFVILS